MSTQWIIIDGYSLLHERAPSRSSDRNFNQAREKLIRDLDRLQNQLAGRVTLVFDGRQYSRQHIGKAEHLEIVFSPAGRTADAVIEEMVFASPHPELIMVVTADRAEADTAAAAGCHTQTCALFLKNLNGRSDELDQARNRVNRHIPRSRLGDVFPE